MRSVWAVLLVVLAVASPAVAQETLDVSQIYLGSAPCRILSGSGSPEGSVTAEPCSVYLRTSDGQIWRKTSSGSTGWVEAGGLPSPGAAGTFLRSNGSAWGASTLVLPNSATANRIPYATGSNTWGESGNLTFNGSTLAVTGAITASTNITVGGHLVPSTSDASDIGTADKLFRSAWISTINALVFAETTQTLFGGYSTIGHDAGSLDADVSAAATTVNFGKTMTPGDWVLIRAHDTSGTIKAEYMLVGSNTSGTTYNVTRDLASSHGTDPAWPAGTPFLVRGASGDGRIDLIAVDQKPRIVFARQGAAYNTQTTDCVIGNLNTYYGYSTDVQGLACGNESGTNISMDASNGFRIRTASGTPFSVDTSGNAVFGGSLAAPTGTIGGWTIGIDALTSTRAGLHSTRVLTGALDFNGLSDYLQRDFASGTIDNFTVGAWVRADSTADNQVPFYVGGVDVSSVNSGYGFRSSSGTWAGYYAGVAFIGAGSTSISISNWQFLTLRRSAGTAQFFVNGSPVGSTVATAPVGPSGWMSVGAINYSGSAAWHFDGRVAGVFLAHEALSNAQIAAMYNAGPGGAGLSGNLVTTGDFDGQSPLFQYFTLDSRAASSLATFRINTASFTVVGNPTATTGPSIAVEWARTQVGSGTGTDTAGVSAPTGGSDIALWAGSVHASRASAPFRVTAAGAVSATSGSIAGLTLASGSMTATNLGVYSGAANTARVEVGTSSNVGGLNSGNGSSDICLWAGAAHASRASAPFRVTCGGAFTATSGSISGSLIVDGSIGSGKLNVSTLSAIAANLGTVTAGTISGVTISASTFTVAGQMSLGEDIGLAFEAAGGDDTDYAVHWDDGSRIMARTDVSSLHMRGPGTATINLYSGSACMWADGGNGYCLDTDALYPETNLSIGLGKIGNRFAYAYIDAIRSGNLDGMGTIPVCANNNGELVPC